MIDGQVDAENKATLPVKVYSNAGQLVEYVGTVDTGFSGYLTLPIAAISRLRLPFDRTDIYTLGDNTDVSFDVYRATLAWDGVDRPIFVLATEGDPLVGMASLRGYSLFIDVVDGGDVRVSALSRP